MCVSLPVSCQLTCLLFGGQFCFRSKSFEEIEICSIKDRVSSGQGNQTKKKGNEERYEVHSVIIGKKHGSFGCDTVIPCENRAADLFPAQ